MSTVNQVLVMLKKEDQVLTKEEHDKFQRLAKSEEYKSLCYELLRHKIGDKRALEFVLFANINYNNNYSQLTYIGHLNYIHLSVVIQGKEYILTSLNSYILPRSVIHFNDEIIELNRIGIEVNNLGVYIPFRKEIENIITSTLNSCWDSFKINA